MDQLARLLILEGTAAVEPYSWVKGSAHDLECARIRLEGQPDDSWFSEKDSGMYALLMARVQRELNRSRILHVTAEDILQQAMSGLLSDGSLGKHRFHAVGVIARENILHGVETPARLASGTLGSWLHRMAINTIKKKDAAFSLDAMVDSHPDWGFDSLTPVQGEKDNVVILVECMAGDTPLSVQLRGLMWLAITKRFRTQAQALGLRIMTAWFQEICNGRLLTPGLDWAKRAELPLTTEEDKVRAKVQTWRTWEKAAPVIREAVQGDPDVASFVDLRLTYEAEVHRH